MRERARERVCERERERGTRPESRTRSSFGAARVNRTASAVTVLEVPALEMLSVAPEAPNANVPSEVNTFVVGVGG